MINRNTIQKVHSALRNKKWVIEGVPGHGDFPKDILDRYGQQLCGNILEWVKSFKDCIHPDGLSWFWSIDDYCNSTPNTEPHWNEFEIQYMRRSIAKGRTSNAIKAKRFWTGYFPIFRSIRGSSLYLAICVIPGEKFGAINRIYQEDFDSPVQKTDSFESLASIIMNGEFDN
ncbi:hypothetical protein LBMAG53_28880 [Planctomycetota bacterium]|nr:hypothetical protein LBMAG53_28880 [Planctomycetota bacterium]